MNKLLMEVLDDRLTEWIGHIEALAIKSEDRTIETEGKLENKIGPPPAQMGKFYKALLIDATIGAVTSI